MYSYMHMHICIYMHIHIYIYLHICTYIQLHICIQAYTYTCIHMYIYVFHMYVCIHLSICLCMNLSEFTAHTCKYAYTNTTSPVRPSRLLDEEFGEYFLSFFLWCRIPFNLWTKRINQADGEHPVNHIRPKKHTVT